MVYAVPVRRDFFARKIVQLSQNWGLEARWHTLPVENFQESALGYDMTPTWRQIQFFLYSEYIVWLTIDWDQTPQGLQHTS